MFSVLGLHPRHGPSAQYAAKDWALFLWATDPLLPQAHDLIKAWRFEYKTVGFYWAKTNRKADPFALSEKGFFCGHRSAPRLLPEGWIAHG
jgi:N6-adenosine-specific RNA methylase IME4